MKVCKACFLEKDILEFRGTGRLCKTCNSKKQLAWYHTKGKFIERHCKFCNIKTSNSNVCSKCHKDNKVQKKSKSELKDEWCENVLIYFLHKRLVFDMNDIMMFIDVQDKICAGNYETFSIDLMPKYFRECLVWLKSRIGDKINWEDKMDIHRYYNRYVKNEF